MKKATIISDSLVKKEFFLEGLQVLQEKKNIDFHFFSWHENLTKSEFQNKILYIEKNGPEFFTPSPELLEVLRETNYLFVHMAPVNKKILSVCENLEFIGVCRGGTENINLEYCDKKDIPVIRMVKNSRATAEFTLGLMLSITRNISTSYNDLQNKNWNKNFFNDGNRKTLNEMKIGIIGLGHVGTEIARMLINMGIEVYGYHNNLTNEKKEEINLPIHYTNLDNIFEDCDIISLHMRLTSNTEGFVNYQLLSKMKDNSYLINTARAGLINENDLIRVLQQKKILGAALDVFWNEPLPTDHPLYTFENVLLTPHIAGDTDVINKAPEMLFREINKFIKGEFTPMLIKKKYMVNSY